MRPKKAVKTKLAEFPVFLEYDLGYEGFVADCPTLPGCMSQGKTKEEALAAEKQEEIAAEANAFETLNTEFQGLQEKSLEAIAEFDKAFAPTEENSWELGKNLLYQQGKKAKADLEKLLSSGAKAKTSKQLNSTLAQAKAKLESIEEAIAQQRDKTVQELGLAEEKQKQFGTPETQQVLVKAKDYAGEGMTFTGWTVARDLNRLFNQGGAESGGGGNLMLFAAAGAVVLIAFAVLFLRRRSAQSAHPEEENGDEKNGEGE